MSRTFWLVTVLALVVWERMSESDTALVSEGEAGIGVPFVHCERKRRPDDDPDA
jgi:hypothetical protein